MFAAILDWRRGGHFKVSPEHVRERRRRYLEHTNVLETTFVTDTGVIRLTDVMIIGPTAGGRMEPQRELLRVIEGVEGEVDCLVRYAPRPSFGKSMPRLRAGNRSVVHRSSKEFLCLQAEQPFELDPATASAECRLQIRAGEKRYLSLAYTACDVGVLSLLGEDAERRYRETVDWWQRWSARCEKDLPYFDAVMRSALVLKMLCYALSGAIVAAPTTSLPEVIGGERNWDYRYCWLRDASLTLRAFMDLGYDYEARSFLDWLLHTTRLTRPRLKVLYDLYGRPNAPERVLDHLEGYRRSRPVRTGNAASGQLQLDIYGAVCLAALGFAERGGEIEFTEKRMLAGFGRVIDATWREPDNGMWEVRGQRQHHTYSKLMCWAALDSLLALNRRIGLPIDRARLERTRHEIREWIETRTYSAGVGSFVSRPGVDWPDASLLAIARCGFLEANEPRMRATFDHIERRLGRGPLLLRYPQGSDGLSGQEGAFGLTGFWAVDYLARAGRITEAESRFEALLDYANELGLFSEEIDLATHEQLGNFPQAFTHVGVISAANALKRAIAAHRS